MWRRILAGRYGMDNLTLVLVFLSVVLFNLDYVWIAGVGLLGYSVFRVASRNIGKRRQELQRFDRVTAGIRQHLAPVGGAVARTLIPLYKAASSYGTRFQQRKSFIFVKCAKCKNTLRLPRNKGKLLATCPVCKSEFTMKT
ncbi:MAG: hypothetical protein FIA99_08905 [Ruminiclostridium sp.]|nr:hypothetical protein [Ruminiclostridium sp.]